MTARGIRLQSSELLKSTSAYVRRSKTNLVRTAMQKAHHVLLALALQFFCRYRPISRKLHEYCYSMGAPPIQNSRALDDYLREADPLFDNNSLENLLRNDNPAVHKELAEILWRSQSAAEAVRDFKALAGEPTKGGYACHRG